MLRDDRQVAIKQVIEALLKSADVHQEGAALLETGIRRRKRAATHDPSPPPADHSATRARWP